MGSLISCPLCVRSSQPAGSLGKTGRRRDSSSIEENIKDVWSCRVSGTLINAREGEEEGSGKVVVMVG